MLIGLFYCSDISVTNVGFWTNVILNLKKGEKKERKSKVEREGERERERERENKR